MVRDDLERQEELNNKGNTTKDKQLEKKELVKSSLNNFRNTKKNVEKFTKRSVEAVVDFAKDKYIDHLKDRILCLKLSKEFFCKEMKLAYVKVNLSVRNKQLNKLSKTYDQYWKDYNRKIKELEHIQNNPHDTLQNKLFKLREKDPDLYTEYCNRKVKELECYYSPQQHKNIDYTLQNMLSEFRKKTGDLFGKRNELDTRIKELRKEEEESKSIIDDCKTQIKKKCI